MKKFLFLTVVFSMLFFSCDWLFDDTEGTKTFWAQDVANSGTHYKVSAELLAKGVYCNVWVEKRSGVTKSTAQKLADTYDYTIYPKMIENFSNKNFDFVGYEFSNILEVADVLADGDGKLTILLLDIKDSYKKGVNDSYVGGYFWAGNFLDTEGSNQCDMIYVDTNPGDPESDESCKTLAHELQHLMNFTTSFVNRTTSDNKGNLVDIFFMDTWIDEGLASAAEWVYSGEYDESRIHWFKNNGRVNSKGEKVMNGSMDKGNNFFVWSNRKEDQYASLDDYATVYLFFQWLRIQDEGSGIYKKIITSDKSDHNAVVNNISGYSTWNDLLETWLAANKINNPTGKYGYKEEKIDGEKIVDITYAPESASAATLKLYPGEAVYSLASTQPSTTPSTNIVYKYITSSAVNSSFSSNTTLLTYNKNTDIEGSSENGTVTGKAPAASVSIAPNGRSVSSSFTFPYRIDAGDLLRRNGAAQNLPFGKLSLLKEKFAKTQAKTNE